MFHLLASQCSEGIFIVRFVSWITYGEHRVQLSWNVILLLEWEVLALKWHFHLQETTKLFMTKEFIKEVSSACFKILLVICVGVILCLFLNNDFRIQRCSVNSWMFERKGLKPQGFVYFMICAVQWFDVLKYHGSSKQNLKKYHRLTCS